VSEVSFNLIGNFDWVVVLPETKRDVPELSQSAVCVSVSSTVRFELLSPPLGIVAGGPAMKQASVPETTIDKYGDPWPNKQHVCSTPRQARDRRVHSVTQSSAVQLSSDAEFGRGVPRLHRGHSARHGSRRRLRALRQGITMPSFGRVLRVHPKCPYTPCVRSAA
jgi:hypothetical protein